MINNVGGPHLKNLPQYARRELKGSHLALAGANTDPTQLLAINWKSSLQLVASVLRIQERGQALRVAALEGAFGDGPGVTG